MQKVPWSGCEGKRSKKAVKVLQFANKKSPFAILQNSGHLIPKDVLCNPRSNQVTTFRPVFELCGHKSGSHPAAKVSPGVGFQVLLSSMGSRS